MFRAGEPDYEYNKGGRFPTYTDMVAYFDGVEVAFHDVTQDYAGELFGSPPHLQRNSKNEPKSSSPWR